MAISDDPVANLQSKVNRLEAELKVAFDRIQAIHYFVSAHYQLDLAANFGSIYEWYEVELAKRAEKSRLGVMISELKQAGYTISKDETKQ